VLYNAAQAHRLAGNKERALELYKSHLQMYADSKRAEIEMHVRNLQEAIARERAEREREKQAVVPPPAADVAPAETRATPPPASPKPEPAPTPPPAREPAREAVPEVVTAAPPARSEDVPQPPPVQVAATESPRHGKALPWGLVIGGGAVGIAGGAAMFLASRWAAHAQDTVDQTLYDASETAWKVGLGAAIAGGLSVATGLVWLALSPSDRPPSTTALAAWADGTGGGVFLARRW
jgi:hypothetical protein